VNYSGSSIPLKLVGALGRQQRSAQLGFLLRK
jgi:hypothetical protein